MFRYASVSHSLLHTLSDVMNMKSFPLLLLPLFLLLLLLIFSFTPFSILIFTDILVLMSFLIAQTICMYSIYFNTLFSSSNQKIIPVQLLQFRFTFDAAFFYYNMNDSIDKGNKSKKTFHAIANYIIAIID